VLLLTGIVLDIGGYRQYSPWVIGAAILALLWMVTRR
jgi:hypothetical protein